MTDSPLWQPSAARVASAKMTAFMRSVSAEHAAEVHDYDSLYRWSIANPELFWPALWRFCGVRSSAGWQEVLTGPERMPGARWFTGARLNFAENLLRLGGDAPALIFRNEAGTRRTLSYGEIQSEVTRLAGALTDAGVAVGDRVAGYLPNLPETVIAMLATTSLGAIWSSCSPDFGAGALLDRFGQIAPRVLITADGYLYAGKRIEVLSRVREVLPQIPSITRVVVLPYLGDPDPGAVPKGVLYGDFLQRAAAAPRAFAQLPFDHPIYVLYSSGTTGRPKCIVHGAGGTLLQHLKELVLHTDLGAEDRIFYYTTCGWMMWNWLASSLATGATVVLYDGSPFHPHPASLFELAAEEQVTVFGTSAKYLSAAEKAGVRPRACYPLGKLRSLLSTGSPLAPESYDYVYREIAPEVQLASISGGTDIISCFALGCPILPVRRGELQCRGLGMKVEVYDTAGRPVLGRKGELVCTAPFPSMPVSFWNDPEGRKYHQAYFERFPGVWTHGDYAEITAHGGLIIYGRSDAVLNPGGVRIGTAEIYRAVEGLPEVLEALAVGQEWQGDVRVILFVKLRSKVLLDADLVRRIQHTVRTQTSPRHVPAKVIAVADIPRTLSGKIVELAVRELIHGRPIQNLDVLANPEALEHFRDLPELAAD